MADRAPNLARLEWIAVEFLDMADGAEGADIQNALVALLVEVDRKATARGRREIALAMAMSQCALHGKPGDPIGLGTPGELPKTVGELMGRWLELIAPDPDAEPTA